MPNEPRYTGAGWERLSDQIDNTVAKPAHRSVRIDRLGTRVPQGFRSQTMKAARRRGLSMEAYIRRALASVMVYDLGLDWWELMVDEPWTQEYAAGLSERRPLAGSHFGPWHIDGMSDPP